MKSFRMAVSMVSVAAIMTSLAACSTEKKSEATPAVNSPSVPAKIKMYVPDFNQPVSTSNAMEIPFVKYLAEKTNTNLNIEFMSASNAIENYRLKVASGDYGDVHLGYGLFDDLIVAGRAMDLKPYIDKYGPNIKKNVPQETWDAITDKGKILGIPSPSFAKTERILYIRKDWLDKLGLQVPKTSDELLHVLREFRDKDPNGNGKKDEIPFSMRDKWSWGENIFGMFGINPDNPVLENGEIINGNMSVNMKKAIGFFKTLYDEKLLDADFLTNQRPQWEQKIKADQVGVWNHAVDLLPKWQDDLNKALPDKKPQVITIATPKANGVTGPVGRIINPISKAYIVDKDAKNPEAIVKLFDWLYSEEGQRFAEMGIEGDTYKKEGDKYVYDAKKDTDSKVNQLRENLFKMHSFNESITAVKQSPEIAAKLKTTVDQANSEGVSYPLLGKPVNPQLNGVKTNLDNAWREMAAKIVVGNSPLDATFDEYVKRYRTEGGAILKEDTDWYNANKKK
ncbi:extracellular solute-binding protein [Paenibacillus roseipurpureus]|uniref:Extracellular solute-binding protein n=1 Tax=Paenibacillus roseopurpureus TaxID=2918901 RepID=A0AA96RJT0_9BACL|nr:extracellular solute-binding protein [Paenibacillus sp. MBLB1832]WNR45768.1 extracellular solute-binding protein [Paenibacillus sp. MBLB1832]